MATLMERAIGAAKLDAAVYEDVEADPGALSQAMTVVVIASVASGLGSGAASGGIGFGLIGGVIGALIGWFVWAFTAWLVGTRMLPEPETKADLNQLLRTTGFASAPGVAGMLGFLPGVGGADALPGFALAARSDGRRGAPGARLHLDGSRDPGVRDRLRDPDRDHLPGGGTRDGYRRGSLRRRDGSADAGPSPDEPERRTTAGRFVRARTP